MPTITATVESSVRRSFRVAQVEGMFGATICNQMQRLKSELPAADEVWRIGLIVGPSGSGKSTIARAAFGDAVYEPADWPADRGIIDAFGDNVPFKQIIRTLTAVGLGSPPSWLKPYQALSTGERFRCDLAKAMLTVRSDPLQRVWETAPKPAETGHYELVVFDEFTSSVDRRVAYMCSMALAKHVRGSSPPLRFVAVTCHDDVAEWLQPDWTLDMGIRDGERTGRLSRRRLRRPPIELSIHRAGRDAWPTFAPHHYLSGELHHSAKCFIGTVGPWDGRTVGNRAFALSTVPWSDGPTVLPAAFAATLPLVGRKNHRRFHRLVVLPEFQGVGIGGRFLDEVAELHREEGLRINIATSHPAIITRCRASPRWRTVCVSRWGRKPRLISGRKHAHSFGRPVVSFEFVSWSSSADANRAGG